MLLDDPESGGDIACPHSRDGADRLRSIRAGEFDDRLPSRRANVHVRRRMLARGQEDHDSKAAYPEDRWHPSNVTERMGYGTPWGAASRSHVMILQRRNEGQK